MLMATYNGVEFVLEQIASIQGQTHSDFALYIRDDGSSDGTIETCRQAAARDNRIKIMHDNHGPSGCAAANFFLMLRAIDLTEYMFVAFSDQDDIWAPAKLARAISCLTEHCAEGYSSDLVAFDNDAGAAWYLKKSDSGRNLDYLFQGASAGCTYLLSQNAAALVKEKVELMRGAFPVDRSHDWLIYAVCRSHGLRWFIDSQSHVFYRQHGHNVYGAMLGAGGFIKKLGLSSTGWYRDHVLWNAKFLQRTDLEQSVLALVQRMGLIDRIKLVWRANEFRRSKRDRMLLQMALLLGRF